MTVYAIGDIHGCLTELHQLLDKIQFNEHSDQLWFTGDLVNRGPHSLAVLRFIKSLGSQQQVVLGNHDLHLLAVTLGKQPTMPEDTFHDVLEADDRDELIDWLRQQPLLHHAHGVTLVHAGLAPSWTLAQAKQLAAEVSLVLQSDAAYEFLQLMYGNQPDLWKNHLTGISRLRCITNYFTRMRFCYANGRLDLQEKGASASGELIPWFNVPNRANQTETIIFGHWAALDKSLNIYGLDTGCVWGHALTAMRLDTFERISLNLTHPQ